MISLEVQLGSQDNLGSREISNKLEIIVAQLCTTNSDLKLGIPSSASPQDGGLIDSYFLFAHNDTIVDLAADQLATEVARWSVSGNTTIILIKRKVGGSLPELVRRVLPTTDPGWVEALPELHFGRYPNDETERWPDRIRYIAKHASRYYAIGGNDVTAVFRNTNHLRQFIKALKPEERVELVEIAASIAANSDHLFVMDWFNSTIDGDIGLARTQALYFLAVLERLREEGELNDIPNINNFHYIDWDKIGG